jgi:Protein of unknown function (DUF3298)
MRTKNRKLLLGFAFSLFLAVTVACGATSTVVQPTPTAPAIPTALPQPSQTPPPLYLSVTLTSAPMEETNQELHYKATAQIPNLQGSQDSRVVKFNNEMTELTQEEIAKFKDNARVAYLTPGSHGSAFDEKYTLLSTPGNVLSLKLDIYNSIAGAAHPTTHTRVVNYDLEAGLDLTLDQLFLSGSNYLEMIANYCIAQLKTRNIGFEAFATGAQPTLENYSNWNITPDGLLITFDPYQVAAYAAGPQLVTVPYAELQSIIDPNGPLKVYLP